MANTASSDQSTIIRVWDLALPASLFPMISSESRMRSFIVSSPYVADGLGLTALSGPALARWSLVGVDSTWHSWSSGISSEWAWIIGLEIIIISYQSETWDNNCTVSGSMCSAAVLYCMAEPVKDACCIDLLKSKTPSLISYLPVFLFLETNKRVQALASPCGCFTHTFTLFTTPHITKSNRIYLGSCNEGDSLSGWATCTHPRNHQISLMI